MNEVSKADGSVQDLSTPSDTSKWMKWTNPMLLSKICLHRRTHLNEWSEQSWCFCPRFVYASTTSKWKEWTKVMLLSINCLHRRPHLNLTIKHWMKWTKLMVKNWWWSIFTWWFFIWGRCHLWYNNVWKWHDGHLFFVCPKLVKCLTI